MNITYSGIVNIKHFDVNGKLLSTYRLHNSGTQSLFNLLYKVLATGVFEYEDRPLYLMITHIESGETESDLLAPLKATECYYGPSYSQEDINCARFTFFIFYAALANVSGSYSLNNRTLNLLTAKNDNTALATLDTGSDTGITLQQGDSISVTWELFFNNEN